LSSFTNLSGIGRRVAPFSPPQIRACKLPSTRLPAPRHVLRTASRLDCSPPAPFAGPQAASNLRRRLDGFRPFPPSGASPTLAPFRVRPRSPIRPVTRRLAAGGVRFLGDLVPARASVRLAASLLAGPGPDGVTSFRTTETRSGWVLSLPRGEVSTAGDDQAPALIARHRRESHFRRPNVTGLPIEPVRPSPGLPPPWWLAGGFGFPL
jgi:hypothetical protein